jgi:hypothetical protein
MFPNIRQERNDKLEILLFGPSFTIARRRNFELNPLNSVFKGK